MMTSGTKDESDVLYALALAMPTPDPKTLDAFVRRHPQHAAALIAVQLALNSEAFGDEEGDEAVDEVVSPAVSRAISHFQNVSFELEKKKGRTQAEVVAALRAAAKLAEADEKSGVTS